MGSSLTPARCRGDLPAFLCERAALRERFSSRHHHPPCRRLPASAQACPNTLNSSSFIVEDKLYYGDNLAVLRDYIPDNSVDLIYLDPPFNSRQDYNVLFAEKDGSRSASQITAFKDTWEWNEEAARSYHEVVEQGGRVADAMRAFRTPIIHRVCCTR